MRYNPLMHGHPAAWDVDRQMHKGGGKGKSGGKSETSQQIDPMMRPYINYGLNEAKALYQSDTPAYYPGQTYVGPSDQTQTALTAAQNRAMAGNPLLPAAQQQQQDVIGGAYLQNNPYFNQAMAGAAQGAQQNFYDAIQQANSNASLAGRYGSAAHFDQTGRAAETMANTLANKYGELAYQNYGAERGRQEAAATNAPAMAQADYYDINQLMNAGQAMEGYEKTALQADIDRFNFEQNAPYAKLQTYLSSVYGAPMGTVSNTKQSGGGGKIICTAMNAAYGFGSFRQTVWLEHSKNLDPAIEKGYHAIFLPIVMWCYTKTPNVAQRAVRAVLEHMARHRTADIWKEKRGKRRDFLGMVYRNTIEPVCYVVGKVV